MIMLGGLLIAAAGDGEPAAANADTVTDPDTAAGDGGGAGGGGSGGGGGQVTPPCHGPGEVDAQGPVDHSKMDHSMHGGAGMEMDHSMHAGHGDGMAHHHSMKGIPMWMFTGGGVFLLLGTMVVVGLRRLSAIDAGHGGQDRGRDRGRGRFDLLAMPRLLALVKKPWFPLLIQTPIVLLFALVIVAGLIGATVTNIAPVLTWTIWWGLLVFIVLFFGKAFCAVCPWDAIAGIIQRGSLFARRLPIRTLNRPWPKWARNIYPATLLFIGLTWLELGFGVTRDAKATAVLGLLMLAMVVGSAIYFERRSFCRYGCLIGRISGLYAMVSPIELRPRDAATCSGCLTKDCGRDTERAMACPTYEFPGRLERNTYCTLCTECVRACPHDNLALRARPFGEDLRHETDFRRDEAYLAIVLLALTSFHGLTMTPTWFVCTDWVQELTGVGYRVAFSLLMAACILLPALLFWIIAWLGNALTRARLGTAEVFCAFAFPLIPIALFYHVAHNVMHFFREAHLLLPRLSDPLGWKWDLFGTARVDYSALLSLETIWVLQTALILIGHIGGILLSERIARRLFRERDDVRWVQIPMLIVMIAFSFYSLWLVHQPMEMRTGM